MATKLAFVRQPAAGTVQRPLTVFEVAIQDTQGERVLPADNAITLTLGNNPGGAQLLGEVTVIANSGIASFAVVGLDKPAAGYALVASAAGLASAISEPFTAAAPAFAVVSSGPFGRPHLHGSRLPAPSAGATTILAGAGNGVYRSLDHGATWTPASLPFGAPSVLRADPKTPGVVYAVGGGTSLVKTTRNGDTWLDTDGAQTLNSGAIDAAVDPMRPAIIYACGYAAALFRTADGGATWQKLTGFPLGCSHITIDPIATSNVYALAYEGTNNRGVYRSAR